MSEFVFEKQPWEQAIEKADSSISAWELLSLLEAEDELTVEEALGILDRQKIALDISCLPPVELHGSAALRLKQESELKTVDRVVQGLDENDPLKLYLQELSATPAAGDPQLLAERYQSGEHHVAEQLVNSCLSLVVQKAMEHTGHGVLLLDLIQEGSLGLWQSILRYDGGEFLPYAQWWICQYMAKCIFLSARSSGVGQKLRQNMEDYLDADQRLLVELGRNPTAEEIAQLLNISPEEGLMLEKMVAAARTAEKRELPEEPEPAPEDDQAVEDTAYFQLRQRIEELLSSLPELDAKLLNLRFGLEGGRPLTPVQTGEILNLTPEEVVSREAAALQKLRNQ